MSETLEPALPDQLDRQAERFALARRGEPTVHRVEHFGPAGRGPVRVKSLRTMLEMLEEAL